MSLAIPASPVLLVARHAGSGQGRKQTELEVDWNTFLCLSGSQLIAVEPKTIPHWGNLVVYLPEPLGVALSERGR